MTPSMYPTFPLYEGKSIRIAPDGFSFYKQEGDKLKTRTFPNSSSALLSTEAPLFFSPDDHIIVVAAQHVPMLVPAELYDAGKDRDYLALQFDTTHLGSTFADTVGAYKAVCFLTQNEKDTLDRMPFPYEVVAETTLLYRFLCEHDTNAALFVAQNPDFTDILVVQKDEPLCVNRFPLTEPADTLFYICHIVKQFNLRDPQVFLHFYAEENKKLPQLLKTYKLNPVIL